MQKSKIFMISGPSGAGEDSIIEKLREIIPFEKIVTSTTREMRPGEADGYPYYFISEEEFKTIISEDGFYEYAEEDRGKLYGVTKKEIERVLALELPVIWKLDYKGVITVKKIVPESVAILIDVPLDVIESRIRRRDNLSEEYIKGRLAYAKGWYDNKDKFDFLVKNEEGKLDEAVTEIVKIIKESI